MKPYVTFRTGQYISTSLSESSETFNDLVECDKEALFEDAASDHNKLWYSYLKGNNALCLDPNVNYAFKGNEGTKDLDVMVIDIDRCKDKPGQSFKCADDIELDKWLANHQFNLYSLENKVDLKMMDGRPVNY
jgi:hypothetical protein